MPHGDGFYVLCDSCRRRIPVDVAHAVVYCYVRQPWFSWVNFTCDYCGETSGKFFGPEEWEQELRWYVRRNFGVISEDFPHEKIVREFAGLYRLKLIEPKMLSNQEETQIAFFRYLLEQGEVC